MSIYLKGTRVAMLGADTVEKSDTTNWVKLGYPRQSLITTEQGA